MKKKDILKISLVQKEPHKIYKIDIKYDYQVNEVCRFIRDNKDKEVSIVINGKHTKFKSFAGKKRFASGFNQGSDFILKLFRETQRDTGNLKAELAQTKKELEKQKVIAVGALDRLRTNNAVKVLRQAAFADHVGEINEDRTLLKDRLDKVDSVFELVVKATTDGQLQKAYKLAKKLKL